MRPQATGAGLHAAERGAPRGAPSSEALERSRALAELIVRDERASGRRARRSTSRSARRRRFAVVRVPLAELKAIGRELGGSVNDVVLAACTTGLRHLLTSRGEQLPPAGPARDGADEPARRVRRARARQPRDLAVRRSAGRRADPRTRACGRDHAETRAAEVLGRRAGRDDADGPRGARAADRRPRGARPDAVLHAHCSTSRSRTCRARNAPLYAFGAELRELYPVVPLAAEHAVGIAIFSYNGMLTFGINADCESTPDLDGTGLRDRGWARATARACAERGKLHLTKK